MGLGFKTLQFENIKKKKNPQWYLLWRCHFQIFSLALSSLLRNTQASCPFLCLSKWSLIPWGAALRKASFCPEDLQNLRKVAYFLDYFWYVSGKQWFSWRNFTSLSLMGNTMLQQEPSASKWGWLREERELLQGRLLVSWGALREFLCLSIKGPLFPPKNKKLCTAFLFDHEGGRKMFHLQRHVLLDSARVARKELPGLQNQGKLMRPCPTQAWE